MTQLDFAPITAAPLRLAECPVYDAAANRLLFCDIPEGTIHAIDLAGGAATSWKFPSVVASFGIAESGRLVVALRDSIVMFDPASGASTTIAEIEKELPTTRLNDGKVGPDGAFWVGTMDKSPDRKPIAALYRVDGSGRVEKKVDQIRVSNGLAFSADGRTLYHSDTRGPWIDRWTLDPSSGAISNRQRFAEPDDTVGRPDGGALDAEGYYWSAGVSAGRLNRFDPDGRLVEGHVVPAVSPTMPCFGGPGLTTLFVSSLREGKSAEQLAQWPLSGSVFRATTPVPAGVPVGRFRDR